MIILIQILGIAVIAWVVAHGVAAIIKPEKKDEKPPEH